MPKPLIVIALPQEIDHAPMPHDLPVLYTGVGKLNAALSLTAAIERHRPDSVLNFGTVGAVSERARDLVEVADVIQRDMDAEPLCPRGVTPFDDTPARLSSGRPGVRCATGDSFVRAADPWLIEQGADVVDMELFALALVCHRRGIPWRAFKFVTDHSDQDAASDWTERAHLGRDLFLARLADIVTPG